METLASRQTIEPRSYEALSLSGCNSILSPYFQTVAYSREEESRQGYQLSLNIMAVTKAIASALGPYIQDLGIDVLFYDGTTFVDEYNIELPSVSQYTSPASIQAYAATCILAYASGKGYTNIATSADITWANAALSAMNRSVSYPSLAVNTARQASTNQDADVTASVDITTALSLSGGAAGKVTLQYADNNTFTTNLVSVSEGTTSNTGTLTIGLALSQIGTAIVKGIVPANKYYRLLTTNITGTPTYGTPLIQEVLL